MSKYKQDISKFTAGVERKLYDKVKKASSETISQNALNDDKCVGITRSASNGCCPMCANLEGNYSKEEAQKSGVLKLHTKDGCTITPKFEKDAHPAKKKQSEAQKVDTDRIIISNASFGRKFGQHAEEWGLEFNDYDRRIFKTTIIKIIQEPDSIVKGTWRNLENVLFYIQKNDVVVVNNGKFVTILKDGVTNNERVKSAMLKSRNRP